MKRIIPVIVLAIVLASSSAWAADVTAAADVNSAYVWRGITLNDGPVVQPSLDISKSGFGFNVWGNFDLGDYKETMDKYNFSEVDLTFSYTLQIDQWKMGAGLIEYLFPATPKSAALGTREIYASVGYTLLEGLVAGLNYYYDIDEYHGYYTDLNLTYTMALMDQLSLETSGKLGYANNEFAKANSTAATDGGFYDFGLSVGVTYALSKEFNVGANLNYTETLDKKALPNANRAAGINGHDATIYGGVSISYLF